MSAKTSAQPGRRTPLSLTGATAKQQQSQKTTSGSNEVQNSIKSDSKTASLNQQTEKTLTEIKESVQKDKKQQGIDKKIQPTSKIPTASLSGQIKKPERNDEKKTQNGVSNSSSNAKEKQANGKDSKINLKENKDKTETLDKDKSDMANNDQIESLKKDESEKNETINKKPDKKNMTKTEDGEKQIIIKTSDIEKETYKEEKKQPEKELRAKRGSFENNQKKNQEKQHEAKQIDVSSGEDKSILSTTEPKQATPIKQSEKSPSNKSTPTRATKTSVPVTTPTKSTSAIVDDIEMEPLKVDKVTPSKVLKPSQEFDNVAPQIVGNEPTATSTPGKFSKRKELVSNLQPRSEIKSDPLIKGPLPDRNICPRTFSQISGRRSIRAGIDYTTPYFQNNAQYRESYRKIDTELDVTSTTNTSLNVTVGSEVPNNSSFSFFGRGRKRDRTPPHSKSAMDLQTDLELSPKSPKRARVDMYGLFSVVASPLSLLRARFSKTSIQSSTPVKQRLKLTETVEDDVEVQNVSGISIEEEVSKNVVVTEDVTATEEVTVENGDKDTPKKTSPSVSGISFEEDDEAVKEAAVFEKCNVEKPTENIDENFDDIKVTETVTVGDPMNKNKRCNVM